MWRLTTMLTILLTTSPLFAADNPDKAPKQLLIISQGPDGHPPGTHEFRLGAKILKRLLDPKPDIRVRVVDAEKSPKHVIPAIEAADGVVLFVSQGARWVGGDRERREAMDRLAARGGGITVLHWAVGAKDARYIETGKRLWGGVHGGPDRQYTVSRATMTPNESHPITRNLDPLTVRDEWYHHLKFAREPEVTPLWRVPIKGEPQVVAWAWERANGGRSFGFVGLHFHENWQEETYRKFITRGVIWTIQ